MDVTRLAAGLLEPIPANRLFGIEVLTAADGRGEVALTVAEGATNVIGSLHSSGLIALLDAAGLAALIAAAPDAEAMSGVVPFGTAAELDFLKPGRGRLVAGAQLGGRDLVLARAFMTGDQPRTQLSTGATITDAEGDIVCRGRFTWRLRRQF